jgi:hypothetical protein
MVTLTQVAAAPPQQLSLSHARMRHWAFTSTAVSSGHQNHRIKLNHPTKIHHDQNMVKLPQKSPEAAAAKVVK